MILTTLIIAIVYPNILVLFSILGGFCGGIIVIVLPSTLYLGYLIVKTKNYDKGSFKYILYTYGSVLLFLIGSTGAVLSVAGLG
jgi:hypothetical protein